jgi:probable selenium-dependent hydroxylase accessory protein YqeC
MLADVFDGGGGVVAIAGAGGKTTLLYRLADEARAAGRRVIITTTTHMGVPAHEPIVLYADGRVDLAGDVEAALEAHGRAVVFARRVRADKVDGLEPAAVDGLARLADLVLVEADGARRRPFKVPAEHEPVVPSSARLLVVVAGLDVLGRPLDEANVHRRERLAAVAGQTLGSPVTEDTIVRALGDPTGYLARAPSGARVAVFLNKAEDEAALAAGERIARRLRSVYDIALVGSARDGRVRSVP